MLTQHFHIDEFIDSQVAARQGIDNTPDEATIGRIYVTALGMEVVRNYLGSVPILISSGYRSPALNAAVGGSKTSDHLLGQACDFTCPSFGTPAQVMAALVKSDIQDHQIILEFQKWVHISFRRGDSNKRQALVIDSTGTRSWV